MVYLQTAVQIVRHMSKGGFLSRYDWHTQGNKERNRLADELGQK
jgi:hypothetical protein